jgi:hypothetical protein
MSRFAKNFHLTCAIVACFTSVVWFAVVGLVFYWHPISPRLDPARIAFVLVPALIVGLGALMEFSFYNDERKGKASREDGSLAGRSRRRLLTSRLEILVAMGVTALLLAQALYWGSNAPGKVSLSLSLRGWLEIAANCGMCWLAYLFIRNTIGRERIFLVGACLGFFLWPLRILWPQLAMPIRYISAFGLVTAIFVALTLLLEPSEQH